MNKLLFNYHTHTSRCGHAIGEDEQYVITAIEAGIKDLGFSDHIMLPGGYEQPGIRGSFYQLDEYIDSINHLKEKYKDKINIYIGFEAEYYPDMEEYYKWLLKEKIDYLILGQHCYLKDDEFHWYFHKDSPIEDIRHYTDDVIKGLKTGMFKYLCHPDLFMHSQKQFTKEIEVESRRILKTCEELDIPIEINLCGKRRKEYNGVTYSYPNDNFFDLVKEYNVRIILGIDAHNPLDINELEIKEGFEFAEKHQLKIIEKFPIK